MITFEFATANQILFGSGLIAKLGQSAAKLGSNALVIHGFPEWEEILEENFYQGWDGAWEEIATAGEPTITDVMQCADLARRMKADLVIGIGGGSTLDTAKATAAMATNPGDLLEYLEVIGEGRKLIEDPLPVIAVPTTAGTGSEVTRNAVIGSPDHSVKVSLRHEKMLPQIALIDPELTLGLPAEVTAYTGLDALVQLIEPLVSRQANPMTDALCREGIKRAAGSLRSAYQDGSKLVYREDMALASLFGGLALANSKLGAVHGIAGPFGGMYPAPHGAICGRLLGPVMLRNIKTLRETGEAPQALERYKEIAQMLTGNPQAEAEQGTAWVDDLVQQMAIPHLGDYGFVEDAMDALVEKSQRASSMKGNPVRLPDKALKDILEQAM